MILQNELILGSYLLDSSKCEDRNQIKKIHTKECIKHESDFWISAGILFAPYELFSFLYFQLIRFYLYYN